MSNQESIKAALQSLHNPEAYNQALVDCNSLLNLSVDTLLGHFQGWLWTEEGSPEYQGCELDYAVKLGQIEEHLTLEGLIYND